jgi:hypothetical protein
MCLFVIVKVDQRKYFSGKKNLAWFSEKCFSERFRRKTLSGNYEKFRNVILFVNYIKFNPQTFNCYIYFVLNIYLFCIAIFLNKKYFNT